MGFRISTGTMKQIRDADKALAALGARLRAARLERNDTMATFAERLGVSERTVRAMEQGLPTVQIGTWLNALWILEALDPLDRLLEARESLLDRARSARTQRRQRASRRRL
jgi:transcriptional regulator with XRE-family HTH domain